MNSKPPKTRPSPSAPTLPHLKPLVGCFHSGQAETSQKVKQAVAESIAAKHADKPSRQKRMSIAEEALARLRGSATANCDLSTDQWMDITRGE